MPKTGIEIVREAIEAFDRRDADGFSALLTKDVEIVPVRAAVEGTVFGGVDADTRAGWVAHLRDGLISYFHTYADRAEALEAVGLRE